MEEKGRARIEEAVKNRKEPRYALFIDESTGYAKNYVVFLMRKKVFGILDRLFLKPDKIRISNIKIRRENGVPGYKIVTPIGEGFLYEQNKFK